jgi:hypothetical protein
VIIFDVLSVTALSRLLSIESEDVMAILHCLHSILDVPNEEQSPVKLLYPSFRDSLLSKQRDQNEQPWVSEHEAHTNLYNCCLRLMSDTMHTDICWKATPIFTHTTYPFCA